jgi:hypothetical protein
MTENCSNHYVILQKGSNAKPINSSNALYYIKFLDDVSNIYVDNLIININGTKYIVNKNDEIEFLKPNTPVVPATDFLNNYLKFNIPSGVKYCITDTTIDATCMAKTTQLADEYYCDIINNLITIPKGTLLYDIYGNKFITDDVIKNVRLC